MESRGWDAHRPSVMHRHRHRATPHNTSQNHRVEMELPFHNRELDTMSIALELSFLIILKCNPIRPNTYTCFVYDLFTNKREYLRTFNKELANQGATAQVVKMLTLFEHRNEAKQPPTDQAS
ncbi:hypothetical protein ACLOJK_014182 [Asimina triloba]